MSELLTVSESVELLGRVRRGTMDSAVRASEVEQDFALRSHKLQTQTQAAFLAEKNRRQTEQDAAQTDLVAQKEHIEAAHQKRKARITVATQNARRRRGEQIDAEEAKHTLENQNYIFEADRARQEDTKKNRTTYDNFVAELSNERAALERLKGKTRATFSGFRSLARLATTSPAPEGLDEASHESRLLEKLREFRDQTSGLLSRANTLVLPMVFRFLPLRLWPLLIAGGAFAFVPELRRFDFAAVPTNVWIVFGGVFAGIVVLHFIGRQLARFAATAAGRSLAAALKLADVCAQKAEASFATETRRIESAHAETTQMLNARWKQVRNDAKTLRDGWNDRLGEQSTRLNETNDERRRLWLKSVNERHEESSSASQQRHSQAMQDIEANHATALNRLTAQRDAVRSQLECEWRDVTSPALTRLHAAESGVAKFFPAWESDVWRGFRLPETFTHAAKFGALSSAVGNVRGAQASMEEFKVPLLVSVPGQASILFETKSSGHDQVIGALNNLVLRLLTSAPPGRLAFTIIDPVGLGQNFAGIMHLADFEERLINNRIWTQQAQIEERLADLNEHIEKVTQMYLRNEYSSLAEYNAQAGRLAEKYQFLVIADFPTNFSDVAVRRLQSIAASGARCGVHILMHWDQRKTPPVDFVPEEIRKNSICIVSRGDGFALADANWEGTKLTLDAPPDAERMTQLLQQIGKDSTDSYRVEMPFGEIAPEDSELWSLDTTNELRVAVGRTGATKLQHLALGQGTRQHGLIAGKTGSGKSTLFHVIVTNLSLWCSPEQVEFYLVDFKKGVEFKTYANHKLPHARVIAIESDREFGLSVLQRVDDELKQRGDLFRKLGAQNIAGYKAAGGTEPMPRVLLMIDEFQELFVEDDRVSQGAALLLDRIVRQGRAFGIHVLLGSQTIGGAYSLARATIGQMVVRIALQCNEADAHLIMNEDNPAPRLLSRPGEAIYNDEGGAIQGNSPFQVVWLPDQVRDEWLAKASALATKNNISAEPIVFEGNAPANVADNSSLMSLLEAKAVQPTNSPRLWLGAPNSIKGPTEAVFNRQSGSHLLIVGQRDEAALAMLGIGLISLAAQLPKAGARFFVFDSSAPDSAEMKFIEQVVAAIPHEVKIVRAGEVDEKLSALAAEQQSRSENSGGGVQTFLFIHGLQRNKKLKFDEEMSFSLDAGAGANPGLQFNKLITEGAGLGFHVIATCDSYNNVMRCLSRKAVSEFEMRVVFQMSANDSASLIESPQANDLGLHRAILFNGQQGWTETFRPYALPEAEWITTAAKSLVRLHG